MVSINDISNVRVASTYSRDGDKVGKVGDVYVDDLTNEPAWVTITAGLFGTKTLFAPLAGARLEGDRLILAYSKDVIAHAPAIADSGHISDVEQQALIDYFTVNQPTAGVPQADAAGAAGGVDAVSPVAADQVAAGTAAAETPAQRATGEPVFAEAAAGIADVEASQVPVASGVDERLATPDAGLHDAAGRLTGAQASADAVSADDASWAAADSIADAAGSPADASTEDASWADDGAATEPAAWGDDVSAADVPADDGASTEPAAWTDDVSAAAVPPDDVTADDATADEVPAAAEPASPSVWDAAPAAAGVAAAAGGTAAAVAASGDVEEEPDAILTTSPYGGRSAEARDADVELSGEGALPGPASGDLEPSVDAPSVIDATEVAPVDESGTVESGVDEPAAVERDAEEGVVSEDAWWPARAETELAASESTGAEPARAMERDGDWVEPHQPVSGVAAAPAEGDTASADEHSGKFRMHPSHTRETIYRDADGNILYSIVQRFEEIFGGSAD